MKQPPFIKQGDTIIMVAPSFGVTTDPYMTRYEAAVKNFKKQGFKVIEGANVHLNEGVVSSAPAKQRACEIMDAFKSEASLIISVGGGELMDEILPYIDFEELKRLPPKWFMGFSDNTNLTFTLTTICDIQSIYGPCTPSFYEKPMRLNQLDAMRMLSGEKEFLGYPKWNKPNYKKKKVENPKPVDPLRRGRYMSLKKITPFQYDAPFEGVILGGCLDCLIALCGTKYDQVSSFIKKQEDGVIWYLEACDLSPLGIRRGIFQLKEAGWFDNAKGFLIGRPLCYPVNMMGVDRFNAATDNLLGLNVPILMDVDLGHLPPSLPMKNGAHATVSFEKENLKIVYDE